MDVTPGKEAATGGRKYLRTCESAVYTRQRAANDIASETKTLARARSSTRVNIPNGKRSLRTAVTPKAIATGRFMETPLRKYFPALWFLCGVMIARAALSIFLPQMCARQTF